MKTIDIIITLMNGNEINSNLNENDFNLIIELINEKNKIFHFRNCLVTGKSVLQDIFVPAANILFIGKLV